MSFKRIADNKLVGGTKESVYDQIRMRDAEDHPPTYIEYGNLRIEFRRASLRKNYVEADVKIYVKE